MRTFGAMVWLVALALAALPVRADDAVPDGDPPQVGGGAWVGGARYLTSDDTLANGATGYVYVVSAASAGAAAWTPYIRDGRVNIYPPYAFPNAAVRIGVGYCTAFRNCDRGSSSSPADFVWTPDPMLLGGTLVATVPSDTHGGGTLTVTLHYTGVGAHEPSLDSERTNDLDPEALSALVAMEGVATVLRATATVSGSYTSSTRGSGDIVSGTGVAINRVAGEALAGAAHPSQVAHTRSCP